MGKLKRKSLYTQFETNLSIPYLKEYDKKTIEKSNSEISNELYKRRINLIKKYLKPDNKYLDFGCGHLKIINRIKKSYGFDINPYVVDKLVSNGKYVNGYDVIGMFDIISFFDSLEHILDIENILKKIKRRALLIIALPVFDLKNIKKSKHYRPYEHYYYFSKNSFIKYMKKLKFELLEVNNDEIQCGREDIYTYVFRKI